MKQGGWMERITRQLAEGDVLSGLARRLSGSDLQSLWLHVLRERSAVRTPAELMAQYERSTMVQPAAADARALCELERLAFAAAAGFEAVDLAPVAPLGLNRVLGEIDQNNCLGAARGVEVLADPTTVAALECARRRRAGVVDPIALCSRSRALRLQPIAGPGFFPHFGLFSLVTSARDRGDYRVEIDALREHLGVHLRLLEQLPGLSAARFDVAIADTAHDARRLELAWTQVCEPLQRAHPRAGFRLDHERQRAMKYYRGLCLSLDVIFADGQRSNLSDGGFTDWTQRLLSNAKERLLVSGIGMERLAVLGAQRT